MSIPSGTSSFQRTLKLLLAVLLASASVAFVGKTLRDNNLWPGLSSETSGGAGNSHNHDEPNLPLLPVNFEEVYSHVRLDLPYTKAIEKETASEFQRLNASTAPYYESGLTAARLFACWVAGGDFYGEGHLHISEVYARDAYDKGCRDPLILSICDVYTFTRQISTSPTGANENLKNTDALLASNYPVILKLQAAAAVARNFCRNAFPKSKTQQRMPSIEAKFPEVRDRWLRLFAQFLQTKPADSVLLRKVEGFTDSMDRDPKGFAKLWESIESMLRQANVSDEVIDPAKADFYVSWAWQARGGGWADTVTDDGWRLMAERLKVAASVLEAASMMYPANPLIPTRMIGVELGQGEGRPRMEKWFKKATEINPGYYSAYNKKMYYLQPRWHGSPQDVLAFGMDCLRTERWQDKIPLVLVEGISTMADQDETIFDNDKIWQLVSNVFTEYLSRYPKSVCYRTQYFYWAVKSKKWDVAREQMKLLGGYWDRYELTRKEFDELRRAIPKG